MAGDLISNILDAIGAAIFYLAVTALVTAIPVTHIALGAMYLHDCPVAPLLPVYVMVGGILALVMMGLFVLNRLLCPAWSCQLTWTVSVFFLVLLCFVWFVFGSYQIYSVYPPNYNKNTTTTKPNSTSSIYNTATLDNQFSPFPENWNQSVPKVNQTWNDANNQTLLRLIQTLSVKNETASGDFIPPQTRAVTAPAPHCNRSLYLFIFWTTTMVYVFAAHALVISFCILGYMKLANVLSTLTF